MPARKLDYDGIARSYDRRYTIDSLANVEQALRSLARRSRAGRILDMGCGSGHWLDRLASTVPWRLGADRCLAMLRVASRADPGARLVCCDACSPPFAPTAFDIALSVNALHQFGDVPGFIRRSAELLRPGGVLALVGMDPRRKSHRWYLYDYFDGTLESDLERYPPQPDLRRWMLAAGFRSIESRTIESIDMTYRGREVLDDYFLEKSASSQLILLKDEAYARGLRRLRESVKQAEREGREVLFPVNIKLILVTGRLPGAR